MKEKQKKKPRRVRSRIVYGLVFPGGKIDVDSLSEVPGKARGMMNLSDGLQGAQVMPMRIVAIDEPVGACTRPHWNGKT